MKTEEAQQTRTRDIVHCTRVRQQPLMLLLLLLLLLLTCLSS